MKFSQKLLDWIWRRLGWNAQAFTDFIDIYFLTWLFGSRHEQYFILKTRNILKHNGLRRKGSGICHWFSFTWKHSHNIRLGVKRIPGSFSGSNQWNKPSTSFDRDPKNDQLLRKENVKELKFWHHPHHTKLMSKKKKMKRTEWRKRKQWNPTLKLQ